MNNKTNFLSKNIPNLITILALCCGLTSIRYSIIGQWNIAIFLIIFAAIFDFFDGWFARQFKRGSNFGAELDSLSDFISFGVAPSILIYFWTLNDLKSFGWSIVLFFSICSALRLARFTADIYLTDKPIDSSMYFVGIPSPAAAGLSLLPYFLFIEFNYLFFQNPFINFINLTIVGLLMISKVPTFSFKKFSFTKKYAPLIILCSVIICIGLLSNIWLTLIILALIYIFSIFYTISKNLKKNIIKN